MQQKKIEELGFILQQFTTQERFKKALRHFEDAIQSRQVDNRLQFSQSLIYQFCYRLRQWKVYNIFMIIISAVYMLLSFWQPKNRNDQRKYSLVTQWIIISFLGLDLLTQIIKQLSFHVLKDCRKKILRVVILSVLWILFVTDIILEQSKTGPVFRFSRVFRTVLPFMYVKDYNRILISLISSYREMIILVVFFISIMWSYAFLCTQLFHFQGFQAQDIYGANYTSFLQMAVNFYILATFDGYPGWAQSSLRYGKYYILFFISQMLLFLFFFVVIPTSLIFLSFKNQFSRLLIQDYFKQKQNLLIAFTCLDYDNQHLLNYKRFSQFMFQYYKRRKDYRYRIYQIFSKIKDPNSSRNAITVAQFMKLNSLLQMYPKYNQPLFPTFGPFFKLSKYLNNTFKLKQFSSDLLQRLMMPVVIVFIVFVLLQVNKIPTFVCQAIFLLQLAIKIISFGVDQYLINDWNKLDLSVIILQWGFQIAFLFSGQFLPLKRSFQLLRVLRLSKNFKILRNYVWCREIVANLTILDTIWRVVSRMLILVGILLKLLYLFFILYYLYSIIGLETWSAIPQVKKDQTYNTYQNYLQSLAGYSILFFQMIVQSGWSTHIFNLSQRFNNTFFPIVYFFSLHFLLLILISIVKGMSWQIYMTIDNQINQLQEKYEGYQQENTQKSFDLNTLQTIIQNNGKLLPLVYQNYQRLLSNFKMKQTLGNKGQHCCLQVTIYDGRKRTKSGIDQQQQIFFRECCIKWFCKRKLQMLICKRDQSAQKNLKIIIQDQNQQAIKDQLNQYITAQYIIKRNMLKDINPQLLSIYQINNLTQVFKSDFQQLHQVDLGPILIYQFYCLNQIRSLLRQNSISHFQFFQALSRIQSNINSVLMNQGSLFKIFYQYEIDSNYMYQFCLRPVAQDLMITPLTKNFWIRNTQSRYSSIPDVFSPPNQDRNQRFVPLKMIKRIINSLYQSFLSMACCLDKSSSFILFNPNKFVYNLHQFNVESQDQQKKISLRCVLLQKNQQRPKGLDTQLNYPIQIPHKKNNKRIDVNQLNKQTVGIQDKIGRQGLPQRLSSQLLLTIKDLFQDNKKQLMRRIQSCFNQRLEEKQKIAQVQQIMY